MKVLLFLLILIDLDLVSAQDTQQPPLPSQGIEINVNDLDVLNSLNGLNGLRCKVENNLTFPVDLTPPPPVLTPFEQLLKRKTPVIVVNGKNGSPTVEGTWPNIEESLRQGAEILKISISLTEDHQFIVFQDPTFHRLVKNYQTTAKDEGKLRRLYPHLIQDFAKLGSGHFNPFDRVFNKKLPFIKMNLRMHDKNSDDEYEIITLDEMLAAQSHQEQGQFVIPSYSIKTHQHDGVIVQLPQRVLPLHGPLVYYLDVKDINQLGKSLDKQRSEDWVLQSRGVMGVKKHTKRAMLALANKIKQYNAYNKVFLVARHPEVARLMRKIDPHIKIMMSSERVGISDSPQKLVKELQMFQEFSPELMEVKSLTHIQNQSVRGLAKDLGTKILFDDRREMDPGQFQEKNQYNLPLFYKGVLASGADIFIESNSSQMLQHYLKGKKDNLEQETPIGQVSFLKDSWVVIPTGRLCQGGLLKIFYQDGRLPACPPSDDPKDKDTLEVFVRFSPRGKVEKALVEKGGKYNLFSIPQEANELEIWFKKVSSCSQIQYDSNFGKNFKFSLCSHSY